MDLISKLDAKGKGLKRYFDGNQCHAGHTSERLVSTGQCCECMRLYRIANKEKNKQYKKEYYQKNKTELSAINKANYEANKGQRAARGKAYRAENIERIKAKKKEYYEANKEEISRVKKERYDPEKNRIQCEKYRRENVESIRKSRKEYRERNADEIKARKAKYFQENKEEIMRKTRERELQNYDKYLEYHRKYYDENKEARSQYKKNNRDKQNQYKREYRKKNPMIVFLRNTLIRLERYGACEKYEEIIGYTQDEFIHHIESQFEDGMTWDRRSEFHIDHIKPIKAFIDEGVTDIKIINALSNLQPLWAKDNMSKGAKY